MTFVVGMQAVGVGIVEVVGVFVEKGEKAAERIPVDDGDGPDVGSFLHGLDIDIQILAALVSVGLVALPVFLVGMEVGTVDGRQQHNLLCGEGAFQRVQGDVDASAIGRGIHRRRALAARHHLLRLTVTVLHLRLALVPPLTDGHAVVIVVGATEYEDGIDVLTVLLQQLVGLTGDVVPLTTADSIDERLDAEPVGEQSPVFFLGGLVARVGDGIAEIGHAFALPRMFDGCTWLCTGSPCQGDECYNCE